MMAGAPIALFIYNRPDHLACTLQSLVANRGFGDAQVFVYGDGPRDEADSVPVAAARKVAREVLGARAEYRFRAENAGLATSIVHGVSELTDLYGRAIVIEDDLRLAPGFLGYMNAALKKYADCADVFQVSGYMFAAPQLAARRKAVFLPIISTWGWGTWKRAWNAFDPQATGWRRLHDDRRLRHRFNFGGVYNYVAMLERQMRGAGNSWGVRWYWSVFQRNGLVCYPPRSLVGNFGMDGTGTHGRGTLRGFGTAAADFPDSEIILPDSSVMHEVDVDEVRRAVWRQNGGWLGYAVDRLRSLRWALGRRRQL